MPATAKQLANLVKARAAKKNAKKADIGADVLPAKNVDDLNLLFGDIGEAAIAQFNEDIPPMQPIAELPKNDQVAAPSAFDNLTPAKVEAIKKKVMKALPKAMRNAKKKGATAQHKAYLHELHKKLLHLIRYYHTKRAELLRAHVAVSNAKKDVIDERRNEVGYARATKQKAPKNAFTKEARAGTGLTSKQRATLIKQLMAQRGLSYAEANKALTRLAKRMK